MEQEPYHYASSAVAAFVLAAAGLMLTALTAFGLRLDWWHLRPSIIMFRWAGLLAGAGLLIGVVGMLRVRLQRRKGIGLAVTAVLVGLVVGAALSTLMTRMRTEPAIGDVTTDPANPPRYRQLARTPPALDEPFRQQDATIEERRALENIEPLRVREDPNAVFEQALAVARELRWAIVSVDRKTRHIEAIDNTFWLGTEHEVAIRVRTEAETGETVVDVRSRTRGDTPTVPGENVDSIRRYLERLAEEVDKPKAPAVTS